MNYEFQIVKVLKVGSISSTDNLLLDYLNNSVGVTFDLNSNS